jgi:hypothetical protein
MLRQNKVEAVRMIRKCFIASFIAFFVLVNRLISHLVKDLVDQQV